MDEGVLSYYVSGFYKLLDSSTRVAEEPPNWDNYTMLVMCICVQ